MDRLGLLFNKLYVGLVAGLVGPWIGFLIFYAITAIAFDQSLAQFTDQVFKNASSNSGTIAISCVFNLALFFLVLNRNYLKAAQGVILATFFYAALVVYFKYAS